MKSSNLKRYKLFASCFLCLFSPHLLAEKSGEYDAKIKTGFVYNFIKIVKPVKDIKESYTLCVVGDSSINAFLPKLNQKQVHEKLIKTVVVRPKDDIKNCDSLFVGMVANKAKLEQILKNAGENGVLTIGDVSQKSNLTVMFHLKQLQGKLRFDVDLKLAQKLHFKLDANLLRLAHIVRK